MTSATLGIPHAGMPPLDDSGPAFSRFELSNPLLFYAPVMAYALYLMAKHRSITLPAIANPLIFAGGLVGERKSEVMDLAQGPARDWIAPYTTIIPADEIDFTHVHADMERAGITYPFVAKPDSGLRGAGVQMIETEEALKAYLQQFPKGQPLVLQALVPYEAEAGVFYVRKPSELRGRIFSITLKYAPYVYGDGRRTVRELILSDPRAAAISEIYLERHEDRLDHVPAVGEPFKLVFAGNHCRGAIFRDGTHLVTDAMLERFDAIAKDVKEFYFGRFDVRFRSIEALQKGEDFRIVEINGTGSEATHIWDRAMGLREAYRILFEQWRMAFEIGAENRGRGHKSIGLFKFLSAWRDELKRGAVYPKTM